LLGKGGLYAGLGIFNQPADTTVWQIAKVREIGIDGIALFSYNSIVGNENYLGTVKRECFQSEAIAPMIKRE
jgi:hypothetical protein